MSSKTGEQLIWQILAQFCHNTFPKKIVIIQKWHKGAINIGLFFVVVKETRSHSFLYWIISTHCLYDLLINVFLKWSYSYWKGIAILLSSTSFASSAESQISCPSTGQGLTSSFPMKYGSFLLLLLPTPPVYLSIISAVPVFYFLFLPWQYGWLKSIWNEKNKKQNKKKRGRGGGNLGIKRGRDKDWAKQARDQESKPGLLFSF